MFVSTAIFVKFVNRVNKESPSEIWLSDSREKLTEWFLGHFADITVPEEIEDTIKEDAFQLRLDQMLVV